MKRSRILSLVLVAVMLVTAFTMPFQATAAIDYSRYNLNTVQQYFLRVIGSLARADYYKNDVLASITVSQAIYEGGWGRYSLPVGGCNIFGIKAFSTWDGMVYDQSTAMVYESYNDFVMAVGQSHLNSVSVWRAHDSWAESVAVHSALFVEEARYAAVVGEKNYSKAANAIVEAGYCSDAEYAANIIKIIQAYKLTEYDDLTPDENGIVTVITNQERKILEIGESFVLPLEFILTETENGTEEVTEGETEGENGEETVPEEKVDPASTVVWASDDPTVATVDENGCVTAVSHGMTLITATLPNGREACSIVYVDCNATAIDKDAEVFTEPSANASTNGKIYRGSALKVTDDTVYQDSEGNKFYKVTGINTKDVLVSGYALCEYVYRNKRNVSTIATVKDDLTLKVNDKYALAVTVAPFDAVDASLTWTSSNTSVATVDQNGVITAKSLGSAVIKATAAGGAEKSINVTVALYYREYRGLISAYESLTVRSEPDSTSSRVGTLAFLSEVKVLGEPDGVWYKITGIGTNGKSVTGFANAAYVRLFSDSYEVTYGKAPANVAVYSECDVYSMSYNNLAEGTDYAVIGDGEEGWSYVVGLKNPSDLKAVAGYARLGSSGGTSGPVSPSQSYYGITTTDLNVREGAGTGYDAVGKFAKGTRIIISGEAENGWYKVSGTAIGGKEVSGYSSVNYINLLYSGTVNATTLNVRESPSTSASVAGQFKNKQEIVLIGDATDNWYAVESTDGSIKGFCSADYIIKNGLLMAEVTVPEDKFSIIDPALSIESDILYGVSANTVVSKLISGFTGNVEITDGAGNILAGDETVGTGCKVRVTENGVTKNVATVLVMGDVDGDGKIATYDYVYVKRHFMGTYELNGLYHEAALVSGKDVLSVADYVLLKRAYFGTYKIS